MRGGRTSTTCPSPAIDAFINVFQRKLKVMSAPLYQLYLQKVGA